MALKFKCECGTELTVPDGSDTSAVLCPSCGKSVAVPTAEQLEARGGGPEPEEDESPSALFRAAIAAFNETDLPDPNDVPPKPSLSPAAAEASDGKQDDEKPAQEKGPDAGKADADAKAEKRDEPEPLFAAPEPPSPAPSDASPPDEEEKLSLQPLEGGKPQHPETRLASKFDPGLKDPPAGKAKDESSEDLPVAEEWVQFAPDVPEESPPSSGPKTQDAMSADAALDAIEKRKLRKALKREGESDVAGAIYEPKDAELHGDVIKFHCKCGKRISAPVKARKSVGKCPKCGARLALPKPESASPPKPGGSGAPAASEDKPKDKPKEKPKKKPKDELGKKDAPRDKGSSNVHAATADAADRLRKKPAKKPAGAHVDAAPESEPASPQWTARFVALQVDLMILAATFFGLAYGLQALSLGSSAWPAAAGAVACVWVLNKIVIVAGVGGSCGMLLAGLRLLSVDGAPVGFGRAAARAVLGVLLIPAAPAAFGDVEGRTPADRIAGTSISSVKQGA